MNSGYNLTNGGKNCIMSDDTKEKISQGNFGKKMSEETKKKMSKYSSNRTDEHNQQISETHKRLELKPPSRKGTQVFNKTKKKISKSLLGRRNSEETINRMRIAKQNISEETKQKIRDNHARYWLGKPRSEETKRKIKETREKNKLKLK